MFSFETISAVQAEQLTGLPTALIQALAQCGEIPAETQGGSLYVGRTALLGWCRLFARVLAAVVSRQPREQIGGGVSARSLVWMTQAGFLTGKDRIRL